MVFTAVNTLWSVFAGGGMVVVTSRTQFLRIVLEGVYSFGREPSTLQQLQETGCDTWSLSQGSAPSFQTFSHRVLRHFLQSREKFWSKYGFFFYVQYILISPSAQNSMKSSSTGRLFLPNRLLGWAVVLQGKPHSQTKFVA